MHNINKNTTSAYANWSHQEVVENQGFGHIGANLSPTKPKFLNPRIQRMACYLVNASNLKVEFKRKTYFYLSS